MALCLGLMATLPPLAAAAPVERGPCFTQGWFIGPQGQPLVMGTVMGTVNIGIETSVKAAAQAQRAAFAKGKRSLTSADLNKTCYQSLQEQGPRDRFLVLFAVDLRTGAYHWSAAHNTTQAFWVSQRGQPWFNLSGLQREAAFDWGDLTFYWINPPNRGQWTGEHILYQFRLPGGVKASESATPGLALSLNTETKRDQDTKTGNKPEAKADSKPDAKPHLALTKTAPAKKQPPQPLPGTVATTPQSPAALWDKLALAGESAEEAGFAPGAALSAGTVGDDSLPVAAPPAPEAPAPPPVPLARASGAGLRPMAAQPRPAAAPPESLWFTPLEQALLKEANQLRRDPAGYAQKVIQPLLGARPSTAKNDALASLARRLRRSAPLPLLRASPPLTVGARLLQRQGTTGQTAQNRDGITSPDKAKRQTAPLPRLHHWLGQDWRGAAQAWATGAGDARALLLSLLGQSAGQDALGALLSPRTTLMGLACGPVGASQLCVQALGTAP